MRRPRPLAALALVLAAVAAPAVAIEEPAYTVVLSDGPFEIRDYAPMVVAETVVTGAQERAGSRAFRTLFEYIDGNNRARREIAMTAPVTQQAADGGWAVRFVLPSSYTLDTAPEPNDPAVTLRAVAPHRAAVIRYSGTWSRERYEDHLRALSDWLGSQGLEPAGEPVWARYNAPYVPWFLRRNEILVPLPRL